VCSAKLVMIIWYPASRNRIIVLLKTLQHIIILENLNNKKWKKGAWYSCGMLVFKMKMSFTRSETTTAWNLFAGYKEKLFGHDDNNAWITWNFTSLCHSKTLTSVKRWIPLIFWFQCQNFYWLIPLLANFLWRLVWRENFYSTSFIWWCVHWPYLVVQVYELITCIGRANENAWNLIYIVQFVVLIIFPHKLFFEKIGFFINIYHVCTVYILNQASTNSDSFVVR